MESEKRANIGVYDEQAERMAAKFDDIGPRREDVERAFGLVGAVRPRVLEIGCGNGRDAVVMLEYTDQYLGIDASFAMIALARQKTARPDKFEMADLEEWPFPSDVDIIFSFASLLHSDEAAVRAVLQKAHVSLAPGGIFYISLKQGTGKVARSDEFGERVYYLYTVDQLIEWAGDCWKTEAVSTQDLAGQMWFTLILRKE